MRHLTLLLLCTVSILIPLTPAYSGVPPIINIQGMLADSLGNALPAGDWTFVFRVFDAKMGGNKVWPASPGEVHVISVGPGGRWTALIGSIEPLTSEGLDVSTLWLEIAVGNGIDPPITLPRVRVAAGAYAMRTATVDGASGGVITSELTIGSGHINTGDHAFVAGENNSVTGDHSTIPGGFSNTASGNKSNVLGGEGNSATSPYSAVGGGWLNDAEGIGSVVSGGSENQASGTGAVVAGGQNNIASGEFSVVGGGGGESVLDANTARGVHSVIGGGASNDAGYTGATIGGGESNNAWGPQATIAGGSHNHASAGSAAIAGGSYNTVYAFASFIGAGNGNRISLLSDYSVLVGGHTNYLDGENAFLGGGTIDSAVADHAVVVGGDNNSATAVRAAVLGGKYNTASAIASVVVGGEYNHAASSYAFVGGGGGNGLGNVTQGAHSVITGGKGNSMTPTGRQSVIGGGESNSVSQEYATISGGQSNSIASIHGVIGGGTSNAILANALPSVIGGGENNRTSGDWTTIAGGRDNTINQAFYGAIPGGYNNAVSGHGSLAAGRHANAAHDGCFVWNSHAFDQLVTTDDDQFLIRAPGGVGLGVDAPMGGLHVTAGPHDIGLFLEAGTRDIGWSSGQNLQIGQWDGSFFTERARFNGSGRLGIGETNVTNILTLPNLAGTGGRGLANRWDTYSSRRWKHDIRPIENALAKVQKLQGVHYKHNNDGAEDIGLIAEDVGEVLPQLVAYEDNGKDARSLDYARLVAVLIEAMKEQQDEIDELRSLIESQASRR